ncbi:MAG: DMT family transporter [Flavobacteriales bacterium]|jgi:drug/metabolite transporter (DMT)-like permease|tara:strand:+ start:3787 stop:4671 length:885 start_codon:yes stop_codon:yes gene_type:complete
MSNNNKKWLYLAILSLVWGSSYILIKKTLIGLTPLQLGSLRIIFTTLILLAIGSSSLKKIPKNKWKWIFLTGYIGSFFPSFLFAFAQTEINSGVAAILNSLTPLATLLIGLGFFKFIIDSKQIIGVIIGLIGSFLLIYEGSTINPDQNLLFVVFIIVASICYAISVNLLKAHLQEVPAISIALGNFICILPPALIILFSSGFLSINFAESPEVKNSLYYILILAIFGSAFAKILFNRFVQIASPVFASSVTYTLPIVAIMWGYLDGESINNRQLLATVVILVGVYLANRKTKII